MAENKVKYYVRIDDKFVEADMQKTEGKISSGGSKIAGVAKGVGVAVGAALAGATAAAVTFGSEFETSMAKASTLIDTQVTDMGALEDQILELSDSTGIAASDLGNSMYNALSAGIELGEDNETMLAALEKSAQLAKAGFTDIDTALTATAKTMNAYGLEGEASIDRVNKVLMQTQNRGITTVGELGSVLSQVTPTAAAMGVEFEQIGASLANMTAQGTPTAQATTQLNGLLAELGKNGTLASRNLEEAAKGTEYAGMSFQDMMAAGVPLNEVLDLMDAHAKDTGVGMLDMFSSIEAGKAALALSGENSQAFAENLEAMSTEADVVGEAFEKVSDTSAEKFSKMLNQLKNMAIELFVQLQPFIEALLPALKDCFDKLLPPIMEMTEKLLPILCELFTQLLDPLAELLESFLPVLIELFEILVPIIAEIAEAVIPVLLEVVRALLPLIETLLEVLEPILKMFLDLLEPILNLISLAIVPLIEIFGYLMEIALIPLTLYLGYLKGVFAAVFNYISDSITNTVQTWIAVFKGLIDFIKNVFTGNWKGAWEAVKDIFWAIATGIGNAFKAPINFIIDLINGFISGLNGIKIPDWVPGVGGMGFSLPNIPRLKTGIDFVPSDYFPAYLDYGERVLTKEENQAFSTLGGLPGIEYALASPSNTSAQGSTVINNNYETKLDQTVNTHDSLSPAELTREAQDFLERSKWRVP